MFKTYLMRYSNAYRFQKLIQKRKFQIYTHKNQSLKQDNYLKDYHILNNGVYTESGAINPVPHWYRFGFFKLFIVITGSLSLGAFVSKVSADFLEDMEIFIPEADD